MAGAGTVSLAGGGLLAACSGRDDPDPTPASPPASATNSTSPTASLSAGSSPVPVAPTGAASATPRPSPQGLPNWDLVRNRIRGELLLPADSGFDSRKRLFNPRFDGVNPSAILRCGAIDDVRVGIEAAQGWGLDVAMRSGGHSYAGYSTGGGLVIDTGSLRGFTANTGTDTALAGAGQRLIDVYTAFAALGMAFPAGSCATVGLAGLALGGGVGVFDRSFGMTCDNVTNVRIVTADLQVLDCNEGENEDLFWACRGGGGSSFGVVTTFTLKGHPQGDVVVFSMSWPWAAAADVLGEWQTWAYEGPDELWANCVISSTGGDSPAISVNGVFRGPLDAANAELDRLAAVAGAPSARNAYVTGLLDAMKIEAGCGQLTIEQCRLPSDAASGQLGREMSHAASAFFRDPLTPAGVRAMLDTVNARQAHGGLGGGGIILDPMGGAINRVAPGATAFVHRNERFSAQYYGPYWDDSVADANQAWVRTTRDTLAPFSSGSAYQNYIDPDQPGWLNAYYGQNLARLKQVKAKYDPGNFFSNAQTIPVA